MSAKKKTTSKAKPGKAPIKNTPAETALFERVVAILEQARNNVVRAVNSNMVLAYWLIGREIVQEIQGGKARAAYGKQVLQNLSRKLSERYGRGYSVTNLQYFRQFHQVYPDRTPVIHQTASGESTLPPPLPIQQTASGELPDTPRRTLSTSMVLDDLLLATKTEETTRGFSPILSWSHYQALMQVENANERLFYEIEAERERWDVRHLRRQIHTFLFARLLKSRDKAGVMEMTREGLSLESPADALRNPYILDFLGMPDSEKFHESALECAIIDNLQKFLLELGKGFAFVGRQKRMQFDSGFFYIDLVFYNCILKCYLLIDLKIGELTHQDVGQMDSYVRMFDDQCLTEGDNPTIGLILCAEKNETVAKYSVLSDRKQIFASKYILYLPTEEELQREIERERRLIEAHAEAKITKRKPKQPPVSEHKFSPKQKNK